MSPPGPVPRIAAYLHDASAALSFTFDDGYRHQVENACEIIEPLGFHGTFFLIPEHMEGETRKENVLSWEEAGQVLDRGHELGTHGSIRRKLHEVDDRTLDEQINGSRQLIGERTGCYPQSYALPGGSRLTDRVYAKARENHWFVRSQQDLPSAMVMGYGNTDRRQWDDQQTRESICQAMEEGAWVLPVIHAIVDGWAPFRSKEEFRIHCEWLKSRQERLWIAPIGTVGRYVRQRNHSSVKLLDSNGVRLRFVIECQQKNPETTDQKLTVVYPVEAGEEQLNAVDAKGRGLSVQRRDQDWLIEVPSDAGPVALNT